MSERITFSDKQVNVQSDLREPFFALNLLGLQNFISGPLPAQGGFAFSPLFSLNTWLAQACFSLAIIVNSTELS